MGIAKVAIIGRPNVGKSSLFNWMLGERVSIVDSVAGVTRDRVTCLLELPGSSSGRSGGEPSDQSGGQESPRYLELTDTGGIGIVDRDDLSADVEAQIQLAISEADAILFVVDAREGMTPLDEKVADRLRSLNLPVLLAANKADDDTQEGNAQEFQQFGWGVVPVSAKQKYGRIRLMAGLESIIPNAVFEREGDAGQTPIMKLAIVGRRNVGKSTFVNTLAREDRVIASPVPGTTRDSIDVRFEMDGRPFLAIDTPGFIRKKSVGTDLDFYSLARAQRSIRTADVVLMFFDCSQQISRMDKQLVNLIEEQGKPCIFVVNKWDKLAGQMPTGRWGDYLRETFATMSHVPIAFITGQTGQNARKLVEQAMKLNRQAGKRVSTNILNKLVAAALDYSPPPLFHFRKPKVYYVTQTDSRPVTIVLFCNMPDAFTPSYRRYMTSVLRDELPFPEVPIRLVFRERQSGDEKEESDSRRRT